MPTYRFVLRRGSAAAVATDVPMAGELLLDTESRKVTVGNGVSAGGQPLAKASVGLENVTNDAQLTAAQLEVDPTLASDSNDKVPSSKAVREYVAANAGEGGGDGAYTPASVPGLLLWLDASTGVLDPSGLECIDGAAVATWQDRSGHGYHVVAPAGSRPTFAASGGGGKPGVVFGGAAYFANSALAVPSLMDCSIIGVFRATSTAENIGIVVLGCDGGSGNDYDAPARLVVAQGTAGNYSPFEVNVAGKVRILLGPRPCARSVYAAQIVGGRIMVSALGNDYRDVRTSATEGWASNLTAATGVLIGGRYLSGGIYSGNRFVGEIQELIVCGSALTSYALARVVDYLAAKWLR